MSRILSIDTVSLEHEGLDYETIDLASSDLQTTPLSLESSSITSITVDESRLTQVERKVEELESHGNVRYDTTQELTQVEQARARANIGIENTDETDPVFTAWKNNTYPSDLGGKVDKVQGKGLSSNDYTNEEKSKLNNIAAGAEVNVQADWNESNSSSDAYIKNKPTIPDVADYFDGAEYDSETKRINFKHGNTVKAYIDATNFVKDGMVSSVAISSGYLVVTFNTDAGLEPISIALTDIFNPTNYYDKTGVDTLLSGKADKVANPTTGNFASLDENGNLVDSGHKHSDYLTSETDPTVPAWAKESSKPSYTASEVGAIPTTAKGYANGVAELDENGKVPSSQMYSYVDDTIEGYLYNGGWYSDSSHTQSVTGETGKIYVELTTNKTYRWSGSGFVEISESLALGETSSTAYAGNKGKANAENIAAIQGLIPSTATTSNKLATASDIPRTYAGSQTSGGAANKAVSIPFGQVDSTSTSTAFTATVDGITELRDGVCVYLKNGVVTSASGYTININNLGAKPVYQTMAAATASTTGFNINYTMLFVYNSSRVAGGCWDMFYGYYYNTDVLGYDIREYNSGSKKVKTACQRYQIMLTCMDGMLLPVYSGAYSNGTSKTLTTEKFNPLGQIYYYYSTTNLSAGGSPSAATLVSQFTYNIVDIRYSFNTGTTLTAGNDVYLVCVPQDDGSAVLHTSPIAFSLPSTEDGLIYKRLGKANGTYTIVLEQDKPCYYYKNGSINLWTGTGTQTDVSKSESSNIIDIGGYDLMKINEVKGKSLVMNQWAAAFDNTWTGNNNCTATLSDNVFTLVPTSNGRISVFEPYTSAKSVDSTHKYYCTISLKANAEITRPVIFSYRRKDFGNGAGYSTDIGTSWTRKSIIANANTTTAGTTSATCIAIQNCTTSDEISIKNYFIVDLTKMFGAGNEPTTVEEVEAILGNDYYEYNTGEVVGNNVEKLDVTGFNIWDEEWEVGSYNANGAKLVATDRIRCKNPIPVLPNTSYYFKFGVIFFYLFLDENQNGIDGVTQKNTDQAIISPANARYVVFYTAGAYGTTYKNDICINKSNTSKNGTYEPYKHSEFPLNLTELTGKVNGEGTSVTIFPDGLHGVGTVYDSLIVDEDGYARKAVKRMGSVDLGSLSWIGFTVNSLDGFYSSGLANIIKNGTTTTPPNVLDKKYKGIPAVAISSTTAGLAVNDKALMVYINGTIYVRDDDYTTAADFKTAMSGVMLYYELATPIEYVLDTPVQCVAKVYPNGTVKQVPVMPDSTPMVMDVTYLRDNALYATKEYVNDLVGDIETLLASI